MLSPRAKKVLHGIGYVCMAIVAIELVVAGDLVLRDWQGAERKIQTKTHDGLLGARDGYDLIVTSAIRLFALLPSDAEPSKGELRFVAMPQLGWHWYAVSLRDTGQRIEGTVITAEPGSLANDFNVAHPISTSFTVSRDAYSQLIQQVDALAAGYGGDKAMCLDGTEIAFERIRNEDVISGQGNVCIDHYEKLGNVFLKFVRQYATLPNLPGRDWYSAPSDAQKAKTINH